MSSNLCAKLETDQSTRGGSMGHNNLLARSFSHEKQQRWLYNFIFAESHTSVAE